MNSILTNKESLFYFAPEIILTATVILILLAEVFWVQPAKRIKQLGFLTVTGLGLALFFSVRLATMEKTFLFFGMSAHDGFAIFFKILILITTFLVFLISVKDSETNKKNLAEYFALLVSMALAGCVLSSATNLLMVYLGIEMLSLFSYVLTGFLKRDRRSAEAAMKYVMYGGAASGAMIYGMSFLYGMTGTLDFVTLGKTLTVMGHSSAGTLTIFVAVVFVLAGLGYKIACVPFHMWCPDVYEGAPTPIAAFFSVVPKVSGFAVLIRFFYGAMSLPRIPTGFAPIHQVDWPLMLATLAVATMTLGNLVAISQTSLKRLLAYSSIAHAGYMLMAFVVLSPQAISGILFYMACYLVMNLGAFLVVILIKEETGSDAIQEFSGLAWRGRDAAMVAIAMTFFLFSLTGLPPTAGFIGKVYLFSAVVQEGWYVLATLGVLNSVVSLYYYARIIRVMYFEEPKALEAKRNLSMLTSNGFSWLSGGRVQKFYVLILGVLVFLTLTLGLYWSPLINSVRNASILLAGT